MYVFICRGAGAALFMFLVFGTLQLPDGLLVRPSPIFWRFIKSCCVVYLLGIVFLLFQERLYELKYTNRYINKKTAVLQLHS